ncbi:MAG: hypothetical protein KF729_13680 [Sandaracinaceae bacterium]|nr:hypothetical protein [Sandaracinaceae bacterium]
MRRAGVLLAARGWVSSRDERAAADSRAALEVTRPLSAEEMAELQLEQGYVERALAIFEALLAEDPENAFYRGRCAWLGRLATARTSLRPRPRGPVASRSPTLAGFAPPRASDAIRPHPIVVVGALAPPPRSKARTGLTRPRSRTRPAR